MNFEEHAGKALVLAPAGIDTPQGRLCTSAEEARAAFSAIGPCVVKAQVPAGKRGKAGGIRIADSAEEAHEAAGAILGMTIADHVVERVLVEERADIVREFYAAILPDSGTKGPLVVVSTEGGMDVEEIAARHPETLLRIPVDIATGFDAAAAREALEGLDLGEAGPRIAETLARLYRAFCDSDGELLEINPLAELADGRFVALDCKFSMDDSAIPRQDALAAAGAAELLTGLERRGAEAGLKFIELAGDVAVLANGAGLTMTTMDVIDHFGGRPANFMEIGGEAYTRAETALDIVLSNRGVKSLVVNFCGAFARTDVMAEGVVNAWKALRPEVPVFFSIHGTGEEEAVRLVREGLGIEPFDLMEDAVQAAVQASR